MIIHIILPDVPSQEYLVRMVASHYQIWKQEKEAREPQWKPENVRFKHDPEWRTRFWSIQAAYDCKHLGWQMIRVVYVAGALSPYVIGWLL